VVRVSVTTTATRTLAVARAVSGAVLLVKAPELLRRIQPDLPRHAVAAARALGARDLLQGAVTAVRPSRPVAHGGAGVDLLHGLSMVVLAVRAPRYRRLAIVAAAQAAASVAAGYGVARWGRARR
jgi:hypothetical protein